MQKNMIITLLFSILIAVFAILNSGVITVNLIFVTLELSAALVILIAASLGAILVYFLDLATKLKLKKTNKQTAIKYEEQLELFTVKEKAYLEEIDGLKNEISIFETQEEAAEKNTEGLETL